MTILNTANDLALQIKISEFSNEIVKIIKNHLIKRGNFLLTTNAEIGICIQKFSRNFIEQNMLQI
jgi:hypothetical protein